MEAPGWEGPLVVEAPGCGGPWAAFSSGAVEAHPTLEYQKIKGDKVYVEAPGWEGPLVVEAPGWEGPLVVEARRLWSPISRIIHIWLEWKIAQWVHPMKDRSDDPSHHERTLLPQSYISLPTIRSWCDGSSDRSFMGWTNWAISPSNQCSTTGVTKAVVCVILSVGWCV